MRRGGLLVAAALMIALGSAGPGWAAHFAQREPEFPPRDYSCRVAGEDAPLGAIRCLRTPQGEHAAQCAISLNMSSWHRLDQPCP